ncbi:ATP-dependent DNA helicase PIF1 [Tanacetum coccineum]
MLNQQHAEAEYQGIANVVVETAWIRNLLRELHSPLLTATLVYCDNVSAVYMSANLVQHQCTKHIEIDIHFVRDMVKAGHVRILHVPSRFQYADIFTKGSQTALNIDHSQDFVRKDFCDWLRWLRKKIRYDGWRLGYDSLSYTYGDMDHNQDAHCQRIIDRINDTNGTAGVWKWKDEFGSTILKQLQRLKASLDWLREDMDVHPLVLEHFHRIDLLDQMVRVRGKYVVFRDSDGVGFSFDSSNSSNYQVLGNLVLEYAIDLNSRAEFFWSRGLISDLTYKLFTFACNYSLYQVTERVDVCVEDEMINYLNRRDVHRDMHAHLVGVHKWEVCSNILDYEPFNIEIVTINIVGSFIKEGVRVLVYRFPGGEKVYYSFDEAEDDTHNYYPLEFLNSLNVSGFPPYHLHLKIRCPIILLRNLDLENRLCNGTRLICKCFDPSVINAEIAVEQHAGVRVLLPRIPLAPSEEDMFPFKLKRT